MSTDNPARRAALAAEAFELVAAGQDVEGLAVLAVKLGLKVFAKPPKPQAVSKAPARRKAISGIHLGQPNSDWNLV
jgi:hypothetical protein